MYDILFVLVQVLYILKIFVTRYAGNNVFTLGWGNGGEIGGKLQITIKIAIKIQTIKVLQL